MNVSPDPLSAQELEALHAYWRAANYLSVGQIYLLANPLLREPLAIEHVKRRLLGHWGTTPGLNFVYAHMNRAIRAHDLDAIFIAGPGHGGPGVVANVYLEGTYTEVYPHIGHDEEGLRRLMRQFSFPGGIPSHVAPESSPTVLARIPPAELRALLEGYGYAPRFVEGEDPPAMHQLMAATLEEVVGEIKEIQRAAREGADPAPPGAAREHGDPASPGPGRERPKWPMIVLRTPKGWTGPKEVDGLPAEGSSSEPTRVLGAWLRDTIRLNPDRFRIVGPDETASNRLSAVFEATDRTWESRRLPTDDHLAPDGRVMEALSEHPHGLGDAEFDALFTADRPVIFAYHGYPWLIHRLTYRRTNHDNIHVRGYKEEGTTTTPFDMVMLNDLDRFHLVIDTATGSCTAARVHRLRAGIAAMAASLGGLDALVFTGGVGEHAPEVRARTAAGLDFLGVALEEEHNRQMSADGEITAADAAVRTLVLSAREDLEIARQVRALLAPGR